MSYRTPVTDTDLHAYVDGELSPARRREVEAYLSANPEKAVEVDDYRRINEALGELYDPVLDEPFPEQLAPPPRREGLLALMRPAGTRAAPRPSRARLFRAAAAAAWMSVGGAIGWSLHPVALVQLAETPVRQDLIGPDLVRPATFAHAVYTSDIRHPVEISAEDEQHLVSWLSDRLHTDIRAPNLAPEGYRLVGGRLLPSTNRMAAQFMYERSDGMRVTLYARRGKWENDATSFRFGREDGLGVFYWIDGPLGFALTGELGRTELLALSKAVYEQLR